MLEQHLQAVAERYEEVGFLLSQPDVIANQPRFRQLSVEYARLDDIMGLYRSYRANLDHQQQAQAMLEDDELRELAMDELKNLNRQGEALARQLQIALLPQDPDDSRNAVLEIRAGTGGEEAALFAADLLRMYQRYAERQGWQLSISALNDTDIGGVKEAVCLVSGQDVYARLKYESGVHRVQRVPQTESGGRIHTSAATVAVLPEDEEIELTIDPNDLRIDTYRSGGAGGQHVNRTDSAVRITHLPTGIVATCQDEKSQIKNREKAMRVLKSRLYDQLRSQQTSRQVDARRSQIGSGDRSQRIRTYNFPQSRVTDHRINLTLYNLDAVLQGECDLMIQPLIEADVAARLQELNS